MRPMSFMDNVTESGNMNKMKDTRPTAVSGKAVACHGKEIGPTYK